jgi:prolyl-tRNA synthetase
VAPAKVYIARLGDGAAAVKQADELYDLLTAQQVPVLYDDRDARAGAKFADADLLGIPYRVVISDKTAESNDYELKSRTAGQAKQVGKDELIKSLGITG